MEIYFILLHNYCLELDGELCIFLFFSRNVFIESNSQVDIPVKMCAAVQIMVLKVLLEKKSLVHISFFFLSCFILLAFNAFISTNDILKN